MTKKEIRKLVKETYDTAVLKGKCEFGIDKLKGFDIEVSSGLYGTSYIYMHFVSGWTTLKGDQCTRKRIIDIFTEFLWMMEI